MKLMTVEERCPAKINLTLQVLGRRGDGFHALHSVVAQTQFADTLRVSWDARQHRGSGGRN
jgi:4-diphosphocytidyl-2C-methyl-D-erythritol kinase